MAIFEAENRNRSKSEDQLTSRIFGALTIMEQEDVLIPLLKKLPTLEGQDFSGEDFDIKLWRYIEKRCPDVRIESNKRLIIIEVKENSPATNGQIIEQYWEARANSDEKKIIHNYFLLTKDREKPDNVNEIEGLLRRKKSDATVHWISWSQIWKSLGEINKENQSLDKISRKLIEDLIILLEAKGMASPTKFKKEWFDGSQRSLYELKDNIMPLWREIQLTINEVNLKIGKEELEKLGAHPYDKNIKINLRNEIDFSNLEGFTFCYKHKNWRKIGEEHDMPCLYIYFDLSSDPRITTGLWLAKQEERHVNEIEKSLKIMKNRDFKFDKDNFAIYEVIKFENVLNGEVVDRLIKGLNKMRVFAESLKELHDELGLKKNSGRSKRRT